MISFKILKALSKEYKTKTLINTRITNLTNLQWEIRGTNELDIQRLTLFLKKPDKTWQKWVTKIMKNILVYDAIGIQKKIGRDGKIEALKLRSGAKIRPLVTDLFETPTPPLPAYEFKGIKYTSDDMKYVMANPQPDSMYGKSPVELMRFNINRLLIDIEPSSRKELERFVSVALEDTEGMDKKLIKDIVDEIILKDFKSEARFYWID